MSTRCESICQVRIEARRLMGTAEGYDARACSAGISQRRTSTYRSNMAAQGSAWFELCIALLRSLVTHYFAHAISPRVLAANAILQTGTNAQKSALWQDLAKGRPLASLSEERGTLCRNEERVRHPRT